MKNIFGLIAIMVALGPCGALAEAQQPGKVPRMGFLSRAYEPSSASEAFVGGLRELGYIEGRNIAIEYRYGVGKPDRYPELAAELVRLKVDIILVGGGSCRPGRPRMRPRRIPSL